MAAGRIPTTANSPITTKGDLFTFSTAPARLAVGANDTTLVADSAQATGLTYKTKGEFNGLTTTGDTIYSSSGTTQARLGIGSTGQVLTVASGIPSWATPAAATFVGVNLARDTTTSLTASTIAYISYPTEIYDTNTFHDSTNPTRITIPAGYGGRYLFTGFIGIGGVGSNSFTMSLRKNGTSNAIPGGQMVLLPNNAGNTAANSFGIMLELVATDYIELGLTVAATSVSYNVASVFQATYLGA